MRILWRISNFADLTGTGGLHVAGRWHSKGRPVIYTAEHPSGALNEMLVNIAREDLPDDFQFLKIELADDVLVEDAGLETLPANWPQDRSISRAIGDGWLARQKSLALRVPSALVPETFNVLLNPAHPDAAKMRIVQSWKADVDRRLR